MKKVVSFILGLALCFGLFAPMSLAKVNTGKEVDWATIYAHGKAEPVVLNGDAISMVMKKGYRKSKDVDSIEFLIRDQPITNEDLEDLEGGTSLTSDKETRLIDDFGKKTSKKAYVMVLFVNSSGKIIGHQNKTVTVNKLAVTAPKKLPQLTNKKYVTYNKKENAVELNLKAVKTSFAFYTFHTSFNILTPGSALATSTLNFEKEKVASNYLEDGWQKGHKTYHTMVILYDKKAQPVGYIAYDINRG
ncbi:hypothetical protein A374_16443 [Fictibacillus macauensis ZFHKF-1]|uniref:Uncharacterized protein n=1 Tax=Fictibacillus macauensis ZFHKF-1 TaxID=1196324 RepID=I8UC74_9BACL|nr:hypothetical protein [Fictibacillus macauensis]EIT84393.1 hypothetical protein A374_16443 [Fictibacillus macauensis ZFHKF-1]